MIVFPEVVIGCPSRASYAYDRPSSTVRMVPTKGRTRYRLKDPLVKEPVSLTFDMTVSQFNAWQTFWTGAGKGTKPFQMALTVDQLPLADYEVQPTGPFSARINSTTFGWTVTVPVEVTNA